MVYLIWDDTHVHDAIFDYVQDKLQRFCNSTAPQRLAL